MFEENLLDDIFEDSWEKAIKPKPGDLFITPEAWQEVLDIRKLTMMRFVRTYARKDKEREVISEFDKKCFVDGIITIFTGKKKEMLESERKSIQFCEQKFGYQIPSLHVHLRPEQRSQQEQIEELEFKNLPL